MAIVTALARQTQRDETRAWAILDQLNVTNGTGWILDAIGRLVGAGRKAYDDAAYKVAIAAEIAVNSSNGKVSELLNIASLASFGDDFEITEYAPASFLMTWISAPGVPVVPLAEALGRATALGINGQLSFSEVTHSERLRWGSVTDPTVGSEWGSDADPTVGAPAASVRQL